MNNSLRLVLLALGATQFLFVGQCRAWENAYVPEKLKSILLYAPDPVFPIASQRMGQHGKGIYRLVINGKTGGVEEVKVLRRTGYRELDASAIWTFFQWKFRPGSIKQLDVPVDFHLIRYMRQTR